MSLIFGALAILGTLITSIQALLTLVFRRKIVPFEAGPRSRRADFVSILKPVCGLDDELEQNLISFTRLEGIAYEVLISAETWDDPAIEVVRRVIAAHPGAPFRIVVDPGSRIGVVNRKVERLIAAANVARGDIFVISDSNVRVEPNDIANLVSAFDDPRVGCVSSLFTGHSPRSLGAVLESLHLLGFVVPGAVLASTVGTPCVVGKSMAISRRAYAAIGGFAWFRRVLAEDQAIGLAVKKAGFEVVLSPVTVRNVIVERTIARAADRQVRWNKIRFAFSHRLYAAELVLNPFFFAILATPFMFALPLVVAVVRIAQMAILNRATNAGLTWKQLATTPLLDLVMLYAWAVPFFSNRVKWRGYEARIGRDTVLIEQAA